VVGQQQRRAYEGTESFMAIKVNPGSSEAAPFIYCDGVATFGVHSSVVLLELAATTIVPVGVDTKSENVIVAHLRAKLIRDAIDKALALPSSDVAMMPMTAATRPN
jgi:hypothetical protein